MCYILIISLPAWYMNVVIALESVLLIIYAKPSQHHSSISFN